MRKTPLAVLIAASLLVVVPSGSASPSASAARTKVSVSSSPFGRIVWGPKRQAVYVFQRDTYKRSRCYGTCAKLWPPVYTTGKPIAGPGIRRGFLGTTRRRDGRRQVTYRGRPLYYYAHEDRGEVLCHNVHLNGGLWWVVGSNGRKRP